MLLRRWSLRTLRLKRATSWRSRSAETATRLNLAKGATHRLLSQLTQRGYLEQDEQSQHYRLTLKMVVLGFRHLTNTGLTDVCQPELDKMANITGELVRLTVVDGDHLIWAAQPGQRNLHRRIVRPSLRTKKLGQL